MRCLAAQGLPDHTGWCVLVEWSNGGHSLECFSSDLDHAEQEKHKMLAYWRGGPRRAESTAVLAITHAAWAAHRRRGDCFAQDCDALIQ